MKEILCDDVSIILNETDTVSDTVKRIDIKNKGTSKFTIDGTGAVSVGGNITSDITAGKIAFSTKTIKKTIGAGGLKAQGTITISGTPIAEETMIIGGTTYTFKASRAAAGEITINADHDIQVTNIVTAITADSADVTAADGAGSTVVVTAKNVGTAGNAIVFSESATGIAMDGTGHLGGTVAGVNKVSADFNFEYAENKTAQPIDLGAIVPARARVADICLITEAQFTGATSLAATVGNASGGDQFIASTNIYTVNTVLAIANEASYKVTPNVAATHVWVGATPGANWSLVGAGKVSVYVTYIDVSGL